MMRHEKVGMVQYVPTISYRTIHMVRYGTISYVRYIWYVWYGMYRIVPYVWYGIVSYHMYDIVR